MLGFCVGFLRPLRGDLGCCPVGSLHVPGLQRAKLGPVHIRYVPQYVLLSFQIKAPYKWPLVWVALGKLVVSDPSTWGVPGAGPHLETCALSVLSRPLGPESLPGYACQPHWRREQIASHMSSIKAASDTCGSPFCSAPRFCTLMKGLQRKCPAVERQKLSCSLGAYRACCSYLVVPKVPCTDMVATWASKGLLYHDFGAYAYTIVVLGAFGSHMGCKCLFCSHGLVR